MMDIKYTGKPTPVTQTHHRRAISETFFIDDILIDDDVVIPPSPLPPTGPHTPPQKMAAYVDKTPSHLRSLSVDADFFEGLMLDGPVLSTGDGSVRRKHRHSNSMDDYFSSSTSSSLEVVDRKAVGADRLAELSLIDPKRAKRILANRQSAARSKERKVRYTGELERKVQTLQTEATTLSAQITLLQKDTSGLTSENKELRLKLQALEQQAHLKDALNEALRNEVQRLKIAAGEIPAGNGNNRGLSSQSPTFNHYFANQNQQQMQQNQTQQPNNSQARGQSQLPFRDFNQRGS